MFDPFSESRERFRIHYEQAPFSVQLLSPQGRTLAVNQAWKELWRVPEHVVESYVLKEYNMLEDPQLAAKGILPYIRRGFEGEATKIPAILYDPAEIGVEGAPRWVTGFIFPIKDKSGKIVEVVLTHDDVTAQKAIEEELRRSNEQLRIIFDGVADGVLVQDSAFRTVYVNQVGARLCGFDSPDEMLRQNMAQVLPQYEMRDEQGRPFPLERLPARIAIAGGDVSRETIIQFKDLVSGREHWSTVKARAILDSEGRPNLAVSIFRDITEFKREQKRRELLAEASKVLFSSLDYHTTLKSVAELVVPELADWCAIDLVEDSGPRSVAVVHTDPGMLEWAREYRESYPTDWSAPMGAPNVLRTGVSELYSHLTEEQVAGAARDARHLELIRHLGMRSVLIVPLTTPKGVVGALTLVSTRSGRHYRADDQRFMEELGRTAALAVENARLYHQATRAIQARDEFLSVASHELRTPLTSLRLHSDVVKRRLERGETEPGQADATRKLVETTQRQVQRLSRLVDDMLDISRIANGKMQLRPGPVELGRLIRDVHERFEPQLQAAACACRLKLEREIPGEWDSYRLEQVLANLLTNAVKYSPGKPIEITAGTQGDCAIVSVRDNGAGIAPENLERIFQRFERAVSSSEVSGLGLGLYISRQIVEAHGGQLTVQSELGRGSVFTIRLPL